LDKVLITGASGTLGSILIKKLLIDNNYHIIATDLSPNLNKYLLHDLRDNNLNVKDIYYYQLNLRNKRKTSKLLEKTKPNYIIHLAAKTNVSRNFLYLEEIYKINYETIFPFINYVYNNENFKRLILTGTCEEYGFNPNPFVETQKIDPVSPYSLSKALLSITAKFLNRTYSIPITVLRPFTFLGPYQTGNMFVPLLFKAIFKKKPFFDMSPGEQIREFNYSGDIADAYIKAITAKNIDGEIINIGRGNGITLSRIVEIILDVTESSIKINKGRIDYRDQEIMTIISDPSKAKRLLGWDVKYSIEESVKKTYEWYKKHPHIFS